MSHTIIQSCLRRIAIILIMFCRPGLANANFVVQMKSGGRFGDNLLSLAHAIYFAQKNNYELLYDPFPYSDQLVLSGLFRKYSKEMDKRFFTVIKYDDGALSQESANGNTLFKIPYFGEAPIEYTVANRKKPFEVDCDNLDFKHALQTAFAPKKKLALIKPCKDKISVAAHLRLGGGIDNFNDDKYGIKRYKIPCEQFYINQIRKLSELLNGAPLYIFLFTDESDPRALMERFSKELNIPSIEFGCRAENRHNLNVLEDFFSIQQYDCLIRAESNYTIMAEKLGDFSIVISPADFMVAPGVPGGKVHVRKQIDRDTITRQRLESET